jgi:hypothetical protein
MNTTTKFRSNTLLAIICLFALSQNVMAQRKHAEKEVKAKTISIYDIDTLTNPVPMQRSLFFDKVLKQQKRADASDGKVDGVIYFGEDSVGTRILTQAIMKDVRQIQIMIENLPIADKFTENQTKLGYHRALETLLIQFNNDNKVDPVYYKKLVSNFKKLVIAKQENKVSEFVQSNVNIYTMANSQLLSEADKDFLCQEIGKAEPVKMIKKLPEFVNKPCADVVISAAARVVPNELFNYATSTNTSIQAAMGRNTDPLVKTIVQIAKQSKDVQKAKPFLGDIYNKKLTIAQVDEITANPDLFYKNLVRLKLENDALGNSTYTDELEYRGLAYIRRMNELHEATDPKVRFKCIENLSPEALYYVIVYGQEEIYTSSFTGSFKILLEKMKPMTGDELFEKMKYDKFRTFIRMCAGYGTLSQFFATMAEDKKTTLMRDFIANLDKGKEDDLESAVDVADAFGSIEDTALIEFLKKEVKVNYEASSKSAKGLKVYALLATLFNSAKDSLTDESLRLQSQNLNLPPINFVPYKNLLDDKGAVIMQAFFYGDEDGKTSYASFLTNFKGPKWKITTSKYWVNITSISGKPVVIYANLPLAEPDDEEAQNRLNKYMDSIGVHATVIIHRGHSYHLPTTLERLTAQTKIVVLGSCGGYHNLSTILNSSPDAQIISTKQTGAMAINEPILKAIDEDLVSGEDINWVAMWQKLAVDFKGKSNEATFKDYVPPHKNLGAIFIKAYRRLGVTDSE